MATTVKIERNSNSTHHEAGPKMDPGVKVDNSHENHAAGVKVKARVRAGRVKIGSRGRLIDL